MPRPMKITAAEARHRLTKSYERAIALYPTTPKDVPLALYIQRNIYYVRKHDLLKKYASDRAHA